jgi:hypothetical protein
MQIDKNHNEIAIFCLGIIVGFIAIMLAIAIVAILKA